MTHYSNTHSNTYIFMLSYIHGDCKGSDHLFTSTNKLMSLTETRIIDLYRYFHTCPVDFKERPSFHLILSFQLLLVFTESLFYFYS